MIPKKTTYRRARRYLFRSHTRVKRPIRTKEVKLKIIPIGGCEEVGRNMTIFEYGNDIVIVDMGLQFPEEDMPGIDYIIPNINYLRGKEKRIKGVIITHGHYDHIGAIPHLSSQLGNPLILGTKLTLALIRKKQEDFKNGRAQLNLKIITPGDQITLGKFKAEFVHVNHNIPDSVAVVLHSPAGTVIHTGDWKFDYTPADELPADFSKFALLGNQGVLALLSDSTNATKPGHQISEQKIGENLEDIIKDAPGRIIIGTFSSLISRIKQVIAIAEKIGKKVAIDGYSMKTNIEVIKELGYLKSGQKSLINTNEIDNYPANKIIIMCTGAQGEQQAVLMRIANKEHRSIRIQPGDTIIFSSSVVPGNESTVQRLQDSLYREGANVIHYEMVDIHAGGHAKQEDIKLMINLVKPKFFIPIEGNLSLLKANAQAAKLVGLPERNILIPTNGRVIELTKNSIHLSNQRVPTDYIFVDGLGVGDVSNVVLRDRQMMSADGMFVVIVTIDRKTGKLVSSPDLISRGFIYMKENKALVEQTRSRVKKLLKDTEPRVEANPNLIKNKIRNDIGRFLFQKTQRRPMILPVVIEV